MYVVSSLYRELPCVKNPVLLLASHRARGTVSTMYGTLPIAASNLPDDVVDRYTAGECAVLAAAVSGTDPTRFRLAGIYPVDDEGRQLDFEHVVVQVGPDLYLDAAGLWTGDRLLREWGWLVDEFGGPEQVRLELCPLDAASLSCYVDDDNWPRLVAEAQAWVPQLLETVAWLPASELWPAPAVSA